MQFKDQPKSTRLKEEFSSDELRSLLRGCVLDLSWYCLTHWGKSLTVTSVLRKPLQQVNLCKAYEFKSGFRHCIGSAIDLSIKVFDVDELNQIEKYIEENWKDYCSLRIHTKGTGKHVHLGLIDDLIDKVKLFRMISTTKNAREWLVE